MNPPADAGGTDKTRPYENSNRGNAISVFGSPDFAFVGTAKGRAQTKDGRVSPGLAKKGPEVGRHD